MSEVLPRDCSKSCTRPANLERAWSRYVHRQRLGTSLQKCRQLLDHSRPVRTLCVAASRYVSETLPQMSEESSDICGLSQVSYSARVYDAGERDCVFPHNSPNTHLRRAFIRKCCNLQTTTTGALCLTPGMMLFCWPA